MTPEIAYLLTCLEQWARGEIDIDAGINPATSDVEHAVAEIRDRLDTLDKLVTLIPMLVDASMAAKNALEALLALDGTEPPEDGHAAWDDAHAAVAGLSAPARDANEWNTGPMPEGKPGDRLAFWPPGEDDPVTLIFNENGPAWAGGNWWLNPGMEWHGSKWMFVGGIVRDAGLANIPTDHPTPGLPPATPTREDEHWTIVLTDILGKGGS